jgi:hypothetical protein
MRCCSAALTCSPLAENLALWAKLVHEIVCLVTPKPGEKVISARSASLNSHAITFRPSVEGWC